MVNFYLHLVAQRAAKARGRRGKAAPRTHVFSSHFFARLACGRDGYDYGAVRRWTKAVVRASARRLLPFS